MNCILPAAALCVVCALLLLSSFVVAAKASQQQQENEERVIFNHHRHEGSSRRDYDVVNVGRVSVQRGGHHARVSSSSSISSSPVPPPMPTAAQQIYADHEIVALIHFNMGTYFGGGDPSCNACNWLGVVNGSASSSDPAAFNPTKLDTDQWARVIRKLGAKHAVLTAKHGCGFLLWPSKVLIPNADDGGKMQQYDYAVGRPGKRSSIQVDILDKFVTSMRKQNLGVGFYYSLKNNFYLNVKDHHFQRRPDNNNTNETFLLPGQVNIGSLGDYETMALGHLRELWTNYGNVTEHWFDGGYTVSIRDRLESLLRGLQPNAVVWRGRGITRSAVSWVGTESGFPVGDDIWSTGCEGGNPGHFNSSEWCPKGCDTTLQEGDRWFFVPSQPIRSLSTMVDLYHATVGRNGVLELDVAVDRTGRIRDDHARRYQELGDYIRECYGNPVVRWKNMNDTNGYIIDLELRTPATIDRIALREDQWRGGQRVRLYTVYIQQQPQEEVKTASASESAVKMDNDDLSSAASSSSWILFSRGRSIGNKRIDIVQRGEPKTMVTKIRFHAEEARDVPWLKEIAAFAPCPRPESSFVVDEDDDGDAADAVAEFASVQ